MHDIWNPWHGCVKISEGCAHCYMYYLDQLRDRRGDVITRNKSGFAYPLSKDRQGDYKVKSGEHVRVCLTSDFFLEQADLWRAEAWEIMRARREVVFHLLTKRPERVMNALPPSWGDGWENVSLSVTAENQRRAEERIPILLRLPFKHKGVMCAPMIGSVDLAPYLADGQIEQVLCGGENYDGARPCRFEWVQALHAACAAQRVQFCFFETGTVFVKDGRTYRMPDKRTQSVMAGRSGMSLRGRDIVYRLELPGSLLPTEPYAPQWRRRCEDCGTRIICNGCGQCGKCEP